MIKLGWIFSILLLTSSLASAAEPVQDGQKKFYFKNGNVALEGEVKKGVLIWQKHYYDDGKILKEITMDRNKMNQKIYYPDGKLQLEAIFTTDDRGANKKIQRQVAYDERGRILKNGVLKVLGWNRKVIAEIPYKDGQINGVDKLYDTDGRLTAEITFRNNVEISRKDYGPDGKVIPKKQ